MSDLPRKWLISLGLAPKQTRPRIFISYRRRDGSAGYAGRIADRLATDFGDDQCFRDVEDIETGTDFVDAIEHAVGACDALVVVIGTDWLTTRDAAGNRRLDEPRDFVRLEIEAALERDIRVIPVLVGGAVMPGPDELPPSINRLAYRQALEMTDTRWDYDVGRLVSSLEGIGIARRAAATAKPSVNYRARLVAAVILLFGGTLVGASLVARALRDAVTSTDALNTVLNPAGNATPIDQQAAVGAPPGVMEEKAAERLTSTPTAAPPSGDAEHPRIVRAMEIADSASAEALRTANASTLNYFFTGQALVEQTTAIQMLVATGTHVHAHIFSRTVNGLQVDGNRAIADIVLEYQVEFHNAQEQCVQRVRRHRSSQLISLERQGGRWLISGEVNRTQMPPELCFQ